jgi:serine/threonine protein kinase
MKAGYTKSVDLWSVGCVTVVLLTGTPPFPLSASGDVEYIEPGDLNEMFMSTKWSEASTMAQNFVLSLLVLDERKRLTAKQALQHCWFINEQYQSELRQLYEEAIRGWRPRGAIDPSKSENCLQFIRKYSDKALRTAPTSRLRLPRSQVVRSVPEKRNVIESGEKIKSVKASSSGRG